MVDFRRLLLIDVGSFGWAIVALVVGVPGFALLLHASGWAPPEIVGALGLVVGLVLALFQIARQHEHALSLQREGKREELRLQIYEAIAAKATMASSSVSRASGFIRAMPMNLSAFVVQTELGWNPGPVEKRASELIDLQSAAGRATADLMIELEKWESALEGADLLRIALASAMHDVNEAFQPMFNAAVPLLPTEIVVRGNEVLNQPPVDREKIKAFEKFAQRYLEVMDEMSCFVFDIIVESQNQLVAGLFSRWVPRRNPADPACVVLSTDSVDYKRLYKHFAEDSAMGKANMSAIASVKAAVSKRQQQR